MSTETSHAVPAWKLEEVRSLKGKIADTPVIAVVGVRDLPASDMQHLRAELRDNTEIRVVRNNIARRALQESDKEGISSLADSLDDQTALIFTSSNPFRLKKILDDSKRAMPLKAGSTAPMDIVVQAGDTSFSPGPMVGKLQSAGIPAAIKGGKVVINQTVTLAKTGEVVNPKLAEILQVMEIFPRLVGLELKAAYHEGVVFRSEDLALDVDAILGQFSQASSQALSFAVQVAYVTPETVEPIMQMAQSKARALVSEAGIPVPGSMDIVLASAQANAQALSALMGGGTPAVQEKQIAPATAEVKVEEEEESEESKEEDAAEGLGSLFG